MTIHDPRFSDVIIIGGGATGAGIARDCALRGLSVTLLNATISPPARRDVTTVCCTAAPAMRSLTLSQRASVSLKTRSSGASPATALNRPTVFFITLPEDDLGFQQTFITACTAAGIQAEAIDPAQARRLEPSVNPALLGAVKVPDGTVDPFRLTAANMLDAREHGAQILTGHHVTGLIREGNTVRGVRVFDAQYNEHRELYAAVVVNAAGDLGPAHRGIRGPVGAHVPGERLAADPRPPHQ